MFVKRDASGFVCAISVEAKDDIQESVADDSSELVMFLNENKQEADQFFQGLDLQMARIMEDTVNLLIDKGYIQLTELPYAAQKKLLSRKEVRGNVNRMKLLDDEDDIPGI